MRLDRALVMRQLCQSRARAKALIQAGHVRVNGVLIDKIAAAVDDDDRVEVTAILNPYVSRGGLKLANALARFNVQCSNDICADIGASTGGFTDCLLQHGAAKVYAIDVGHDQLAKELRGDPRVVNIENCNIRHFDRALIAESLDLIVVDVSFISLTLVLPTLCELFTDSSQAIVLIKPQFEVGKAGLGKGGIVKGVKQHVRVLQSLISCFEHHQLNVSCLHDSGIKGVKGNLEFIALITTGVANNRPWQTRELEAIVTRAHQTVR